MTWLGDTPQEVVGAHIEMMQRLQAEEAMNASTEIAMGRTLKASRRTWDAWKRAAAPRRAAKRATAADLVSVGIGVRRG